MLRQLLKGVVLRRAARQIPILKLLSLAEVAILARRHVTHLDPTERRRLVALVRRGRGLAPKEREELRGLVSRLELRALAGGAADRVSPVPLPRKLTKSRY